MPLPTAQSSPTPKSISLLTGTVSPEDNVPHFNPKSINTIITLSKKTQGSINRIQASFDAIETNINNSHSHDEIRGLRDTESNIDDLFLATERLLQAKAKERDDEKRRTRNFAFEDADLGLDTTLPPLPKIGAGLVDKGRVAQHSGAQMSTTVNDRETKKVNEEKWKDKSKVKGKGQGKKAEEAVRQSRELETPHANKGKGPGKGGTATEEMVLRNQERTKPNDDKGKGTGKENEEPTRGLSRPSEDVLKARRVTRWPCPEDFRS